MIFLKASQSGQDQSFLKLQLSYSKTKKPAVFLVICSTAPPSGVVISKKRRKCLKFILKSRVRERKSTQQSYHLELKGR